MKSFLIAWLWLAVLAGYGADSPLTADVLVHLYNDRALWGGDRLSLDADGNVELRQFTGPKEKRYRLKLTPAELKELLEFIPASGIGDYRRHPRNGVPDESSTHITLMLPGHAKIEAWKWARDKEPLFDKLYERLSQLVTRAAKTPAYFEDER